MPFGSDYTEQAKKHCRSCQREILIVEDPDGHTIDLDATPIPNGEWAVVKQKANKVTELDKKLHRPRHQGHWKSCSSARRPRAVFAPKK